MPQVIDSRLRQEEPTDRSLTVRANFFPAIVYSLGIARLTCTNARVRFSAKVYLRTSHYRGRVIMSREDPHPPLYQHCDCTSASHRSTTLNAGIELQCRS